MNGPQKVIKVGEWLDHCIRKNEQMHVMLFTYLATQLILPYRSFGQLHSQATRKK